MCTLPSPSPLPAPSSTLSLLAGGSARPVKEINALISSFSATYRPARAHAATPSSAPRALENRGRRLLSGHRRSFATAVSVVTVLCKGSVRKGRPFPRLYVSRTLIVLR